LTKKQSSLIIDRKGLSVKEAMKRRNDATYVADLDPYKRIFPYIMKRRCDSLVFHQFTVDLTKAVKFVKDINKFQPGNHQYRVFELFLAALMRTIAMRPQLNRFLMNYDIWQRNELSANFVVKEDYTDEAREHSTVVYFREDMTFPEIADIINETIEHARKGGDNDTDAAIDFFLKFPKFLLKTAVLLISFLDRHGIAPKALRDADGLHATVFLANLGSINLPSSPHHHLYEWGTTSIFLTMGMLRRKRVYDENGERSYIDAMDIGVTVDERITDGFYFIKSMHLFQDYLNNPERLMERPQLPDRGPTVKEMRKQKRMLKKQARKQRRQKEKATA